MRKKSYMNIDDLMYTSKNKRNLGEEEEKREKKRLSWQR